MAKDLGRISFAAMVWLAPGLLFAQNAELARDRAGRWNVKAIGWAVTVPANARPRLTQAINDAVSVLRRMPTLAQPKGFDVNIDPRAEWQDLDAQGEGRRPKFASAQIRVELAAYERGANGPASRVVAAIQIRMNDLSLFAGWEAGHGVASDDADARFLNDPPEPFEMRGQWPVFHDWSERESWVVMTRAKAPLFVPVPRERYLQFEIEETGKLTGRKMASMGKPPSNDPAVVAAWQEAQRRMAEINQTFNEGKAQIQAQQDGLNKQLSEMPAADRRAATFLASPNPTKEGESEFLGRGDSDAKAVVYRNPGLMSDRLPRGTPQILAIEFEARDDWPELAPKLEQEVDWSAFEKILTAAP